MSINKICIAFLYSAIVLRYWQAYLKFSFFIVFYKISIRMVFTIKKKNLHKILLFKMN